MIELTIKQIKISDLATLRKQQIAYNKLVNAKQKESVCNAKAYQYARFIDSVIQAEKESIANCIACLQGIENKDAFTLNEIREMEALLLI